MLKKLTLILLCSPAIFAMTEVKHAAVLKLTLQNGTEVEVPSYVAELSETIREALNLFGDDTPISLPLLTESEWQLICEELPLVYSFFREKTESSRKVLLASLRRLSIDEFLSCMHSADYLGIPIVIDACVELSYAGHVNNISFEQLCTFFPNNVGEIILRQACAKCGPYDASELVSYKDDGVDGASAVCVSPDGKIISGSYDGTVRVLDSQGKQLAVYRGHEGLVKAVCITPDGKIVSGSNDRTVRIWDPEGNQLAICEGHELWVTAVCVTPDGKIVSGSNDRTIRMWDIEGNQLAVCEGYEGRITTVCLMPDGKIVSGFWDGMVRIWDTEGNQLEICEGHESWVNAVCVTPDGKIVSGSTDKTVRLWNTEGNQLAVCKDHEDEVNAVCITPDGKIVSGSSDGTIRIWDTDGNQLSICEGHEGQVYTVCVTPDGKIVSGSADSTVRIWDLQGTQISVGRGHTSWVSAVCITRGGNVVSRSHDGSLRIWDTSFPLTDVQAEKVWVYLQENPELKAFKQDGWIHIKKLLQEHEELPTNDRNSYD